MILFLNFTPITFMGGAEKVMLEYAHTVSKKEDVNLIDVSTKIANIYGKAVLNRTFDSHINDHKLNQIENHLSLTWSSFIPFTKDWSNARNIFKESRIVYTRFEFLEIALCLYFGGLAVFSKTIAGMHLTPIYSSPRGIMDKLHNFLYGSFIYKYFLKKTSKIHVITERDKKLLEAYYGLENKMVVLPIGVDFTNIKVNNQYRKIKDLNIIFVGELSTRKGVDTLINIIKKSPSYFNYNLVGDGPLRDDVVKLQDSTNCHYKGYVSANKLSELYSGSDVLLFPSRAEAFGIVMAEAIAYGAIIVNSSEVTLSLPKYIENTVSSRNIEKYLNVLENIYAEKNKKNIDKKKIREFAHSNYSMSEINKRFLKEIINI